MLRGSAAGCFKMQSSGVTDTSNEIPQRNLSHWKQDDNERNPHTSAGVTGSAQTRLPADLSERIKETSRK